MKSIPTSLGYFCLLGFTLCHMACGNDENNSPNNQQIVFDTNRDLDDNQGAEIYITNEDGTEFTRLTFSPGFDTDPRWNSNGSKIAFTSHRDGKSNIYLMNSDGSQQTRITDPLVGGSFPDFSPDNSLIVYHSSNGNGADLGIYLMNADGSNKHRLGAAFGDSEPAFSPDGSKIVFTSSRTGDNEIYIMNVDGSNQIQLTNEIYDDIMPDMSPDGSKIIFVSFRNNKKAVYVMNSDGSNQTPLYTSLSPNQPNDPTFSSDGNKIVFSNLNRLHIMNADGSEVVALPGVGYNGNPDWL